MKRDWKKESTERVFTCPFIRVDKSIFSDGRGFRDEFYSLPFSDWVHILPRFANGDILTISQYRFGTEADSLEFPGGQVEKGDSLEATVRNELVQETGYVSDSISYMGWVYPNPAIQANKCHFYLADNIIKQSDQELEPAEDIHLHIYSEKEVDTFFRNGLLTHSLAIVAYLKYKIFVGSTL